jgi:hypothetical protein
LTQGGTEGSWVSSGLGKGADRLVLLAQEAEGETLAVA